MNKTFFNQPVRNDLITHDNNRKNAAGQGDDNTTGSFVLYYKVIPIDLNKQEALDDDLNAVQQINVTGDLEEQSTVFLIIAKAKETNLDLHNEL